MTSVDMERFLTLCLDLTAERDREALLSSILDAAMDISNCDAGTLYLVEDDGLHFCRMVTRSMNIRQGGHDAPISLPPVPLDPKYVCSWAILNNQAINVADVRSDDRFDFTGSLRYDSMTGYRTKSMLVVPMGDDKGRLIGVTQLINALDETGESAPFSPDIELMVQAITSQAAITATNMLYNEQINGLLDSLVRTLSTAIDERSHYNANHTRNMVRCGEAFLDWMDRVNHPWKFDADKRRAFLMSVWLHDVGKLAVPLEVMDKRTRLGPLIEPIQERFRMIGLLDKIAALERKISPEELERRNRERMDRLALVNRMDGASFLTDADLSALDALANLTFTDEYGEAQRWITGEEYRCLTIRKGTLTPEERAVMQSHAVVTARILSHVSFPRMFAQVPQWAAAHHELLNGGGYPNHLTEKDIPKEVRLLTILDIFDALTAKDRPYKPAISLNKTFGILHDMARNHEIDGEILSWFEESGAWERILS